MADPDPPETSRRAFHEITDDGTLGDQQERVRAHLAASPAAITANELNQQLGGKGFHKRLSELERVGVVRRAGERACTITGRVCAVWVATGETPRALPATEPADRAAGPRPPTPAEADEMARRLADRLEADDGPGGPDAVLWRLHAWLAAGVPGVAVRATRGSSPPAPPAVQSVPPPAPAAGPTAMPRSTPDLRPRQGRLFG